MSNTNNYLHPLVEAIKNIDTDENVSGKWVYDEIVATTRIVEEQKVYFWIRLYLKEENPNVQIGDDITINWTPSGEKLATKFAAYGKQGLERDHIGEVTNYNPEDDKRVLCLLIDNKMVNFNDEIPFIRTLFKTGYHYEYQLVKRDELQFVVNRTNVVLEYYDCDF
jgi:hypothetical protein